MSSSRGKKIAPTPAATPLEMAGKNTTAKKEERPPRNDTPALPPSSTKSSSSSLSSEDDHFALKQINANLFFHFEKSGELTFRCEKPKRTLRLTMEQTLATVTKAGEMFKAIRSLAQNDASLVDAEYVS